MNYVNVIGIVYAFLALSVIVFFHELGHFLLAKKTGMKVERFGLGMGPVIQIGKVKLAFTKGDTEYCLCWFPIGGFCQIKGEEEDSTDEDSYNAKPPLSKFLVAFAGPFTNILVTFVILIVMFSMIGNPFKMQVASLKAGFPAEKAGILPNDLIIGINGQKLYEWTKIQPFIASSIGKEVTLIIVRDNKEIHIPVIPVENPEIVPPVKKDNKKETVKIVPVGIVGMMMKPSDEKVPFGKAITGSFKKMGEFFSEFLKFIGMAFTGKVKGDNFAGPLKIIDIAKETVKVSMSAFVLFMAFLSLNLGVLNLFPFPPLDGGKIIFALLEAIFKKKVNKKVEIWINTAGFALLMGLMVFVTFKDIISLWFSKI
jgi:regulator of sigma E protease